MDGSLVRPSIAEEYPRPYGCMTHRMRRLYNKYITSLGVNHPDELESFRDQINLFIDSLWREECEDAYCQGVLKSIKENGYRQYQKLKSIDSFQWVTVNPKPETSFESFKKDVDKYVNQKHIEAAEYVYEQRGSNDDTMGQGFHVHLLVKTKTNKADFEKRTRAKFSKYCGNDKHIYMKSCPLKFIKDKQAYMRGEKIEPGKETKCEIDKLWRIKNNLNQYYITNNGIQTESLEESQSSAEEEENFSSTD